MHPALSQERKFAYIEGSGWRCFTPPAVDRGEELTVGATPQEDVLGMTSESERIASESLGPLLIDVAPSGESPHAGRTDVIVVEVDGDEGLTWLTLPQFGIEICGETNEQLLTDLFRRIVAFYAGLKELPPECINEVEEEQIRLVEEIFLPWLAVLMAQNPAYFAAPPIGVHLTASDLHQASA